MKKSERYGKKPSRGMGNTAPLEPPKRVRTPPPADDNQETRDRHAKALAHAGAIASSSTSAAVSSIVSSSPEKPQDEAKRLAHADISWQPGTRLTSSAERSPKALALASNEDQSNIFRMPPPANSSSLTSSSNTSRVSPKALALAPSNGNQTNVSRVAPATVISTASSSTGRSSVNATNTVSPSLETMSSISKEAVLSSMDSVNAKSLAHSNETPEEGEIQVSDLTEPTQTPPQEPGAYRVGGFFDSTGNVQDDDGDEFEITSASIAPDQQDDQDDITEQEAAQLDSLRQVEEAIVGTTTEEDLSSEKKQSYFKFIVIGMAAVIALTVAISVGVVVGSKNKKQSPSVAITTSPSMSPTTVPSSSFSPTIQGSAWEQISQDFDGDKRGAEFGIGMALSGDGRTIVAATGISVKAPGVEVDYLEVYESSGQNGNWTRKGGDIMIGDSYQISLSITQDGNRILVGVPNERETFVDRALVFEWDSESGAWVQLAEIIPDFAATFFGRDTAISRAGDTLAISDPKSYNLAGSVSIYRLDEVSKTLSRFGSDIVGQSEGDMLGFSISLSGDGSTLAISSEGIVNGNVKVYSFDGSEWRQLGSDLQPDGLGQSFGFSVSLSENGLILAVGDPTDTNAEESPLISRTGSVEVFEFDGTDWVQLGKPIYGDAQLVNCGYVVSLSADGKVLAAAKPAYDSQRAFELFSVSSVSSVATFKYYDKGWVQFGNTVVAQSTDLSQPNWFGWHLKLSDDGRFLAASDKFDTNDGGFQSGSVRVFQLF